MTEEHEADFLAGMGFDPTKFSPTGIGDLGQVVGQTWRPGVYRATPLAAPRGGVTGAARSARILNPASCKAAGGTWRPGRRYCDFGSGRGGLLGLDGDWDQAAKQVREYMRKQVQYRKEAENPELRRRREGCQRLGGTWHPVRRMCAAQGRHLIWTNGTFRGLGGLEESKGLSGAAVLLAVAGLAWILLKSK